MNFLALVGIVAVVFAELADLVTTQAALKMSRGQEGNPVVRASLDHFVGLKLGVTAAIVLVLLVIRKSMPGPTAITAWLVAAGLGYVAYRNTRVGK